MDLMVNDQSSDTSDITRACEEGNLQLLQDVVQRVGSLETFDLSSLVNNDGLFQISAGCRL